MIFNKILLVLILTLLQCVFSNGKKSNGDLTERKAALQNLLNEIEGMYDAIHHKYVIHGNESYSDEEIDHYRHIFELQKRHFRAAWGNGSAFEDLLRADEHADKEGHVHDVIDAVHEHHRHTKKIHHALNEHVSRNTNDTHLNLSGHVARTMLLEMESVSLKKGGKVDPKVKVKKTNAYKTIRNGFAAFGRALLTILRLIADLIINSAVGVGVEAKVTPLPVPSAGIGPSFLLCWDATDTYKRMLQGISDRKNAQTCGQWYDTQTSSDVCTYCS